MYMCAHVLWYTCGGQRTTCRIPFSPAMHMPGFEVGSPGLMANTPSHLAGPIFLNVKS